MKILKYILSIALIIPMALNAGNLEIVNAKIREIKTQYAPDSRQAVWEVSAVSEGNAVVLKGKTTELSAHQKLLTELSRQNINCKDSIVVYPTDKWGLVRISVAHLRGKPSHSAEIVSQAIMGTPLRLLEKVGEWWRVQSPDGYISYMIGNSFVQKTSAEINQWKKADRMVVTSLDQIKVYSSADKKCYKDIVTDLVNGCIVVCEKTQDSMIQIVLPDGRKAWADAASFENISKWADQKFAPEKIIETGYNPYSKGIYMCDCDCKGHGQITLLEELERVKSQKKKSNKKD